MATICVSFPLNALDYVRHRPAPFLSHESGVYLPTPNIYVSFKLLYVFGCTIPFVRPSPLVARTDMGGPTAGDVGWKETPAFNNQSEYT